MSRPMHAEVGVTQEPALANGFQACPDTPETVGQDAVFRGCASLRAGTNTFIMIGAPT